MMSAVANDVGFAHVFVRQITAQGRGRRRARRAVDQRQLGEPVKAFVKAKELGLVTIALSGKSGGQLTRLGLDHCLIVQTDSIHRIQECHVVIYHLLWDLVQHALGGMTAPISRASPRKGLHEVRRRIPRSGQASSSSRRSVRSWADRALPIETALHHEVCGATPTRSSARHRDLLPEEIELVHGPGCPVCVLPMGRVDDCITIAQTPGTIFTTFGRRHARPRLEAEPAPGQGPTAPTCGMVYSPADALALARKHPTSRWCSSGSASRPRCRAPRSRAARRGRADRQLLLFCNHITIIPTVKAILDSPDFQIDGFLAPAT